MRITTIIALISCLTFTSFAQQTYIPDTGFEEALIFEGLDTVLNDSVPTSAIDTVTALNLEPFGIVDLTGIQDFTALKSLVCVNNTIQQIDLSNNVFLEFLNCENNNVTSINVSNCPNLEQLIADNNNLTSIDVTQNPLLEKIDLTQNGIGSIDVLQNPALKILILNNTSLTSIDLSANTLLENLDLSTNQLSALDLSNAPNLITLVLIGSSLGQLDLSVNTDLESLLISGNNLTDLDLINNTQLEFISCPFNNLSSLTLPSTNQTILGFLGTLNNPDLNCITSDNPTYINANWSLTIDTFTVISTFCSTGINDLESSIEIYPNPTENGFITVNTEIHGEYELINLNGSRLQKGKISNQANLLDFSTFSNGMYILRLQLGDQVITRQIQLF